MEVKFTVCTFYKVYSALKETIILNYLLCMVADWSSMCIYIYAPCMNGDCSLVSDIIITHTLTVMSKVQKIRC